MFGCLFLVVLLRERGLIYANDIERGVDIFRLTDPSPAQRPAKFDYLNPQTQERRLR